MDETASRRTRVGELEELRQYGGKVPVGAARTVREINQKELEADQRAHDALLTRGNQLLAASGVGLSLLVGLTQVRAVDTGVERTLLIIALILAGLAAVLAVSGLRVAASKGSNSENAFAAHVSPATSVEDWLHDYELSMAITYADAQMELRERHQRRADRIQLAQVAYLAFLALLAGLGVAIPL